MTTMKLNAHEALAPDQDQDQRFIVYANQFPVTSKNKFSYQVEASKERMKGREYFNLGVEREMVMALTINVEPLVANEQGNGKCRPSTSRVTMI